MRIFLVKQIVFKVEPMSTSLSELSTENARNLYTDLSRNLAPNIAFSWQDPADFVKDITNYKCEGVSDVTDLSGAKVRWLELEKQLQQAKDRVFQQSCKPVGSNANWGRITQLEELQGSTLEDVGLQGIKTPVRSAEFYQDIGDYLFRQKNSSVHYLNDHARLADEGELSAPIVRAIEEEEDNDTITESKWSCKGCSKYFATKASLKRHHDRKKSCKELCEKQDISGTVLEVPDKPYIVDWIDQLQTKAISGNTDAPYCKHCDVEFANKSNLNKHLSKSVACDKLAKQEFLMLISSK